jgi:hypothetical protein
MFSGPAIAGWARSEKARKDKEAFNIKKREERLRKLLWDPGARTRWVTERITSMKQ